MRQVIVRVLRPTTTKAAARATTPAAEEPEQKMGEPMVDEAADANAIEVKNEFILYDYFKF